MALCEGPPVTGSSPHKGFLWCAPEQTTEKTMQMPVILEAMRPIVTSLKCCMRTSWRGNASCNWAWPGCPFTTLHRRYNDRGGVSGHQPHDCLLSRLFRRRSKKTSKLRVTGLCAGNSPAIGEFPAQRASNAENVSIWLRHHVPWIISITSWKSNYMLSHSEVCD